jgi:uncharacterized protein YxeA
MKKWLYLIVPSVLLAVFLFFYFAHREQAHERQIARKAEEARIAQEEAERKAEVERKAREDAERRAAERLAAERQRESERRAKQEEEDRRIQDAFTRYTAEADAFAKKAAELEIELDALRQAKAKLNAEVLALNKQVETALIDQRTAELQNQRMIQMIANRAAESSLTRMPTAPAASGR